MPDIITLGETMVCFNPTAPGYLRYVNNFTKNIAGAESNVCIALSRLETSCGWISRVGNDEFGKFIINTIRGEGVDVSQVSIDSNHSTGIMFKQLNPSDETNVFYYRNNSAATYISSEHIDYSYFEGCKIFHVTGINHLISPCINETMINSIKIAKQKGAKISYDPNIRLTLGNIETLLPHVQSILPLVDIILLGLNEAQLLFNTVDTDTISNILFDYGIKLVVIKLGEKGAIIYSKQEHIFSKSFPTDCIDPVGAGDAFNAGFLYGILNNLSLSECGVIANAMGSFAVRFVGDFENLPTLDKISNFISGKTEIYR